MARLARRPLIALAAAGLTLSALAACADSTNTGGSTSTGGSGSSSGGSGSSSGGSGSGGSGSGAGAVKQGGTYTSVDEDHAIDVNAPINPYNQSSNAFGGYNAMQLAWSKNSLTDPNALYPGLAKSWTVSAGGTKITAHLQPNAKWSDGTPVTATDIKTSAAIAFTQGSGAFSVTAGAAGSLGNVKVLNPTTVEFDEASGTPSNSFLRNVLTMYVLPNSVYGAQLPKDIWSTIATATNPKAGKGAITKAQNTIGALGKKLVNYGPKQDVSAGPFTLRRVNPGAAVLTKNPDYFGADKIAPSQVVLKNFSGNQQIWSYLKASQLDSAPYVATPADVMKSILSVKGNTTVTGISQVSASLAFNQSVAPFDNIHVRRGLAYAIDRKLVTKIGESTSGKASDVTTGIIAASAKTLLGGELSKLNPYSLSTSKAAQEFTAAGLKQSGGKWMLAGGKPFTVDIQVPTGFSDWIAGAQSMATQLNKLGIASQVKTSADYPTYLTEIAEGKYDVGFWLTSLGPDMFNAYARLYGPSNGWNTTGNNVTHSPPGKNGNWMGGAEFASVPGLGSINPGVLTNKLNTTKPSEQGPLIQKLAKYTNDQLPVIQLWDYENVQFVNTTHWTDFPPNNDQALRLSPGVWMQLGFIHAR